MDTAPLPAVGTPENFRSFTTPRRGPPATAAMECQLRTVHLLQDLFATMKAVVNEWSGTALVLYARLPATAGLPWHYGGFGLTLKITCQLWLASEDAEEDDYLTVQLGERAGWWHDIPTLRVSVSKGGSVTRAEALNQPREGGDTERLLQQALAGQGVRGRAELLDAFSHNPYDWKNMNFRLSHRWGQ